MSVSVNCRVCGQPHFAPEPLPEPIPCAICGTPVLISGSGGTWESRLVGWLKLYATPDDRGAGDTVERLLARAGGRGVKALLERLSLPCGCDARQEWLNMQWPWRWDKVATPARAWISKYIRQHVNM